MGGAPTLPSRGVGAPHQCPRVNHKNEVEESSMSRACTFNFETDDCLPATSNSNENDNPRHFPANKKCRMSFSGTACDSAESYKFNFQKRDRKEKKEGQGKKHSRDKGGGGGEGREVQRNVSACWYVHQHNIHTHII